MGRPSSNKRRYWGPFDTSHHNDLQQVRGYSNYNSSHVNTAISEIASGIIHGKHQHQQQHQEQQRKHVPCRKKICRDEYHEEQEEDNDADIEDDDNTMIANADDDEENFIASNSSWLNPSIVEWISSSPGSSSSTKPHTEESVAFSKNEEASSEKTKKHNEEAKTAQENQVTVENENDDDDDDTVSITEQLNALHYQLCHIKRKLNPASIQCADVCNQYVVYRKEKQQQKHNQQNYFYDDLDVPMIDKNNNTNEEELAYVSAVSSYNDDSTNNDEDCYHHDNNMENSKFSMPIQIKTTAKDEFELARKSCNPYESLSEKKKTNKNRKKMMKHRKKNKTFSSSFPCTSLCNNFINRSALKLVNINYLLGFDLLKQHQQQHNQHQQHQDSFVWIDLAGAPGGFSEYVLYLIADLLKKHQFHDFMYDRYLGYGMSLCGTNEHGLGLQWNLREQKQYYHYTVPYRGKSEVSFHIIGKNGSNNERSRFMSTSTTSSGNSNSNKYYNNNGDIYNYNNTISLRNRIYQDLNQYRCSSSSSSSSSTNGFEGELQDDKNSCGVANLIVADGGFDKQRNVEDQELITSKLIICEVSSCISLLKVGGTFIIKMFGFRSSQMKNVLYELFISFDKVKIEKPIISRPASSERYVICMGYKGNPVNGWNGYQWKNRLLLSGGGGIGECMTTTTTTNSLNSSRIAASFCGRDKIEEFEHYINKIEYDILKLNCNTCFNILSTLERKTNYYNNIIMSSSSSSVPSFGGTGTTLPMLATSQAMTTTSKATTTTSKATTTKQENFSIQQQVDDQKYDEMIVEEEEDDDNNDDDDEKNNDDSMHSNYHYCRYNDEIDEEEGYHRSINNHHYNGNRSSPLDKNISIDIDENIIQMYGRVWGIH